jgi:hypothetical protein
MWSIHFFVKIINRYSDASGYKSKTELGPKSKKQKADAAAGFMGEVFGGIKAALVAMGRRFAAAFAEAAYELQYPGRVTRATGEETAGMMQFVGLSFNQTRKLNTWFQVYNFFFSSSYGHLHLLSPSF